MKANVVLMLEALRFFAETGSKPRDADDDTALVRRGGRQPTGPRFVEREAAEQSGALCWSRRLDGKVKTGRKGTGMFKLTGPRRAGTRRSRT